MTDVTPPATDAGGGSPRRLKIALLVSVALNLLILGAVAGTMLGMRHNFPGRHYGGRGEDFGLMGITRFMPEDRRKEMRKQLSADRAKLRPVVDEIRDLRKAAADQLAADPFDSAALEAAIAKVAEKERALRQTALNAFLIRAETLTPDERRQLAEAWRKKSEFFHRGFKRKKDGEASESKDAPPPPAATQPPQQ